MKIKLLEHVNLRTTDIHKLEKWYCQVLGLKIGYRPPFKANGRWLYAGTIPMVHLLEVKKQQICDIPTMEHFAMRCCGLKDFLEILEEKGISYRGVRVPELRIFQINIADPDGNNMHLDFPPDEADELGFE
jgi:catechol-2,3-dioxygenase